MNAGMADDQAAVNVGGSEETTIHVLRDCSVPVVSCQVARDFFSLPLVD